MESELHGICNAALKTAGLLTRLGFDYARFPPILLVAQLDSAIVS